MTKDDDEEVLPQIADPETFELPNTISKLTKEQREIFTYFVPIDGMEKQICQALTGAMLHLTNGKNASTGNMYYPGWLRKWKDRACNEYCEGIAE